MTNDNTETINEIPDSLEQADWSILEHRGVSDVLSQVAHKVAGEFAGITTVEDVHQDGSIWLALNAEAVRAYVSDEFVGARNLYRRLHSRMVDEARKLARVANREVPFHIVVEKESDQGE